MFVTLWTLFLAIGFSSAQSLSASNDTSLVGNATQLTLIVTPMAGLRFNIEPLTGPAGLTEAAQPISNVPLVLANLSIATNVPKGAIAYLNCEASAYPSSNLGVNDVFNMAASRGPSAILLFSLSSNHCNYTGGGAPSFDFVYSMIGADSSAMLLSKLQGTTISSNLQPVNNLQASISNMTNDILNHFNTGNGTDNGNGGAFGPVPTTQVAMIILYSITGVITALFLIIIITGAIRAHRHPERYGPRNAILGRPRQSRAKGIARAVLETLPIKKFGEKDDKANTDVELATDTNHAETTEAGASTAAPAVAERRGSSDSIHEVQEPAGGSSSEEGTGKAAAVAGSSAEKSAEEEPEIAHGGHSEDKDEGLSCSICTEDFVKGEDIRVLPCDHKFHPECVDPWLLNVSGTCPLCRIDLRTTGTTDPANATAASAEPATDESTPLPPPLALAEGSAAPPVSRNRISRYLELRRMAPEERMAALRAMRRDRQDSQAAAQPEEGHARRVRRSNLFSTVFRIHTRHMDEPSAAGATDGAPADETPAERRRRSSRYGTFVG